MVLSVGSWGDALGKVAALLAALALLSAAGNPRPNADAKDDLPPEHPMTFILDETLCNGSMGECGIIAEGSIDRGAAKRFREFVAAHKLTSGQVRFDSGGSDLDSGYLLGRAIRELGFDTAIASKFVSYRKADPCYTLRPPLVGSTKDPEVKLDALRRELAVGECELGGLVGLDRRGQCLSACAFAYLGGVVRSFPKSDMFTWNDNPAEMIKLLSGGSGDVEKQKYIGFHPFAPNARIDIPERAKEEQVSAWAQRQLPRMLEYLSDMGYANPKIFIDFMNKGKFGLTPSTNLFKYPTVSELVSAGVLAQGDFLPFRLVPESNGLALISSFSNGLLWEKQFSFFCARQDSQPSKLAVMLSGGRDQARESGPSPRVTFAGMGEPPPNLETLLGADLKVSDTLNVLRTMWRYEWLQKDPWKFVIKADGHDVYTGGQFESHPPAETGPDGKPLPTSLDSRHIVFDVNDGFRYTNANSVMPDGRDLQHFVIYLDSSQIEKIRNSRRMVIYYGTGSSRKAGFNLDLDFSKQLRILMSNCITLKPPIDKVDGYDEGLKL